MARTATPDNMYIRDKILARLREANGRLVSYDELIKCSGTTNRAALAIHINILRERHEIRCLRNEGFRLGKHNSAGDESEDEIGGRSWRPEHFGDPLLDALRLHHPEHDHA